MKIKANGSLRSIFLSGYGTVEFDSKQTAEVPERLKKQIENSNYLSVVTKKNKKETVENDS